MTPEVAAELRQHSTSFAGFLHTDYQAALCLCSLGARESLPQKSSKPQPMSGLQDGGICFACGGLTVRTGTCTTCTECGETGGCG